ncbi:hypothetical protein ElyMa_005211700 [Elysia marginata]|uniref:Secreted protein n=1 Tax=Elysia marginata TaxID=1093978 RepID=A0AAV4JWB9_9GAST|nr:hypothetical protein ElyMa_005211700 [Elysia marginata]
MMRKHRMVTHVLLEVALALVTVAAQMVSHPTLLQVAPKSVQRNPGLDVESSVWTLMLLKILPPKQAIPFRNTHILTTWMWLQQY